MNTPALQKKLKFLSKFYRPSQKNSVQTAGAAGAGGAVACPGCAASVSKRLIAQHLQVCPLCGHHFPISAKQRLHMLIDEGSRQPLPPPQAGVDPIGFPQYQNKLRDARERTGLSDAAVCVQACISGLPAVIVVLDSRFFMGSMGVAVGEAVTGAVEYAQHRRLPLLIFSASGGARMQEGILSLMQMAKTSAALARFAQSGGLYISYLTHPTTGGVSASFAGLGDITLAEPGALIGFAGPRVIEQTIRQKLPEGFQRAEFQEDHGFVDRIVPRDQMRPVLSLLLGIHQREGAGA